MNRSNSLANSVSSTTTTPFSCSLSALIKLERLVYRLNSILSINLGEYEEFQLQKHFKLLLQPFGSLFRKCETNPQVLIGQIPRQQYQNEILKLKLTVFNENNCEFEYENRIQWIESRINLLNKMIKELEVVGAGAVDIVDTCYTDCNVDELINPAIPTIPVISETTVIDELYILPPKPETTFSIPKQNSQSEQSKDTLTFSEDIQNVHDSLTTDLIATVQLIKRNNLHIQKMVKDDDKIINQAAGLLATNSDTMQKEGKNLKSYSKTAWVSFWKMLLILLFVCFTFIFVYIFIRLT